MAQPHICRPFAGQAWHLWHWVARLDLVEARVTPVTPRFCVAGVAQTHIHRPFTWQRGRTSHLPSVCVAGVALIALGGALGLGLGAPDARDAAPLLRGRHGKLTSTLIPRGRRGTTSHLPSFCFCLAGLAQTHPPSFHLAGVAGVAQPHIYHRFAWQVVHMALAGAL